MRTFIALVQEVNSKMDDFSTAGTRLAATLELLELVLLHLDFKTLLFAKRVCHDFERAILWSKRLQKKLFLLPVKTFKEAYFLNMMIDDDFVIIGTRTHKKGRLPLTVVNHVLLRFLCGTGTPRPWYEVSEVTINEPARLLKNGSWRNMFISQPPSVPPLMLGLRTHESIPTVRLRSQSRTLKYQTVDSSITVENSMNQMEEQIMKKHGCTVDWARSTWNIHPYCNLKYDIVRFRDFYAWFLEKHDRWCVAGRHNCEKCSRKLPAMHV